MQLLSSLLNVSDILGKIGNVRRKDESANWVLRRQNPTFAIDSAMSFSSAFNIASTVRLPPTAPRNFDTAASVTSSFVCDDNMRDTKVENLCP